MFSLETSIKKWVSEGIDLINVRGCSGQQNSAGVIFPIKE
jgi:hypothetical protein